MEMGCFGIGVSRLLAAALEYGLNTQKERLIWPKAIAPYHICIACLAKVGMIQSHIDIKEMESAFTLWEG